MFRSSGKTLLGLALMVPLTLAAASSPYAAEPASPNVEINQVTDPAAEVVYDMFRFEPDMVKIKTGQAVRFLNSRGQHTVKSVRKMLPPGAKKILISHSDTADVVFDIPGIYGFTCGIHGRYGMAMVVVVGDSSEWTNAEGLLDRLPGGRAGEKLRPLVEQILAQR